MSIHTTNTTTTTTAAFFASRQDDGCTQVETVPELDVEDREDSSRAAAPAPWGRLMRLSGGVAVPLMPRPEQTQGRALNEVTLGRGKVRLQACRPRLVSPARVSKGRFDRVAPR